MNIKEIQDLIKFVSKAGVSEVEIEQKDFKLTIKTQDLSAREEKQIIVQAAPAALPQVAAPVAAAPVAPAPPSAPAAAPASDASTYITVKSPMSGTFYRSSGPDKQPFVNVGESISTGTTVCITEAMKLIN